MPAGTEEEFADLLQEPAVLRTRWRSTMQAARIDGRLSLTDRIAFGLPEPPKPLYAKHLFDAKSGTNG